MGIYSKYIQIEGLDIDDVPLEQTVCIWKNGKVEISHENKEVLKSNQNSMRSCRMDEWIIKYYVNEEHWAQGSSRLF